MHSDLNLLKLYSILFIYVIARSALLNKYVYDKI